MAENGRPVSECFTPGGHFGSDGTTADELQTPINPLSKSLTDMVTGVLCQEELARHRPDLRKSVSSAACPPRDATAPGQVGHSVARRPHSITGTPPLGGTAVAALNYLRPCEGGHLTHTGSLDGDYGPHRSRSVSLHATREARSQEPASCCEAGFPCHGMGYFSRGVPGCHTLRYQQALTPTHSNSVTPCRGHNYSSPTLLQRGLPNCAQSPNSSPRGSWGTLQACRATCVVHLANHACPEDTFSAHCHPLAVPSAVRLLPRAAGAGEECGGQRSLPYGVALPFPRLTSSVSETRLDGRQVTRCCATVCPSPSPRRQPIEGPTSREVGTMTAPLELRDVGVQTGWPESPPVHVFPEVSLAGEENDGTGAGVGQTSPVKEVMWDAEGMTWEVYGAAVDPQELGLAIQRHLELQIKEAAASRASKAPRRDTGTSRQSGQHRKNRGLMGLLRKHAFCTRSSTTGD